ncbi:MAG: cation transporter [Proteocatella sp.]
MKKIERAEKNILWLSFGGGLCFAIMEFVMAIFSGSQAVLMDAAYDASELIIIGLTLLLTPLFHKPITEKKPYGNLQAEAIFVVVKGFMMLSVTLGLSANSIRIVLSGGNTVQGAQISVFQLALGFLSVMVFFIMRKINKSIHSPIMDTEIYGWKLDIYYSLGMSLAFFISTLLQNTRFSPILPYFDQIVVIAIVIFMLPESILMLIKAMRSMFLFAPEEEIIEKVKAISNDILKASEFTAEFFDITYTGRRLWVEIYFTTERKFISVNKLKSVTDNLNDALRIEFHDCVCELVPEV